MEEYPPLLDECEAGVMQIRADQLRGNSQAASIREPAHHPGTRSSPTMRANPWGSMEEAREMLSRTPVTLGWATFVTRSQVTGVKPK
jgi:hypothetical protein